MAEERVYDKFEKKITRWLTALPDQRFLELELCEKQIKAWMACRWFQVLVALCWHTRYTHASDPIRPLLKDKRIDRNIYHRVWLTVDLFEDLWNLIQIAEPFVRAEFERADADYPFKDAFELFMRIIWEKSNCEFSLCLKSSHEVSRPKYEKAYRLSSKAFKNKTPLSDDEEKYVQKVFSQHRIIEWLQITLGICHQKATRDELTLKRKLARFYTTLGECCDREATIVREVKSYAWKDGELGWGNKDGTYSFP